MRFVLSLIVCVMLIGLVGRASADTIGMVTSQPQDVTFPLGPHYRIGRYLPFQMTWVEPARPSFRIEADGAVQSEIKLDSGRNHATAPLLAVTRLESLPWYANGAAHPVASSVRPLADDEVLIAANQIDEMLAAGLFPGQRIITAQLDLADPLPGPAMAWSVLDAVLLDGVSGARVSERQVVTLLAGGTTVAIRSNTRPGGAWSWQRQGAWWVIRPDAPPVDLVQPDRYALVSGVATPAGFRRVLLFTLVAFVLAVLAASLWRSRWTWIVVVLLAALVTSGLLVWRANQPTSVPTSFEERSGSWLDRWTIHTAFSDGPFRQPITASDTAAWPVFFSRRHVQDIDLRLECAADGTPVAFVGSLKRGQSLAFVTRSLAAAH